MTGRAAKGPPAPFFIMPGTRVCPAQAKGHLLKPESCGWPAFPGQLNFRPRRKTPSFSCGWTAFPGQLNQRQLADLGARPGLVVKDGDRNGALFAGAGGRLYLADLKATRTGAASFVTTFHRVSKRDAKRLARRGQVLYGSLYLD